MALKLLLAYNIKDLREEEYYRFILQEFLPRAEQIGLVMRVGWQTAYGNYPSRLLEFIADDDTTLRQALRTDTWDSIETKLGEFVTAYERRMVLEKPGFQFFIPQHSQLN